MCGGGEQGDRLLEGVGSRDLNLHFPSPTLSEARVPLELASARIGKRAAATSCPLLPPVLLNGFLQEYSVLRFLLLDPWNQSPVSGPSPTFLLDAGIRGVQRCRGKERESLAFPRDDRRGRKESAVTHLEPAWLPGCLPHPSSGCHSCLPQSSPTSWSRVVHALLEGSLFRHSQHSLAFMVGTTNWPGESLLRMPLPELSTLLGGCKQALPFLSF